MSHGPPFPNVLALAPAPDDERKLYAAASDPITGQSALFVSTDGGQSWSTLAPAIPGETIRAVAVDPGKPARLAAVTTGAPETVHVYRTEDGGATWFAVFSFVSSVTHGTLFFDTAGTGTVYLRWNGPVYVSRLGMAWERPAPVEYLFGAGHIPHLLFIFSFWPGPRGLVFWTTQSYEGGLPPLKNVVMQGSPDSNYVVFADAPCLDPTPVTYDPVDPDVAYAGAHGCGTLLKTTDGGRTWESTSLSGIHAEDVLVGPASSAVYVRTEADLFRSTDGGDTWTTQSLPSAAVNELLLSPSGLTLFAATEAGVFSRPVSRTRIVTR